MTTLPFLVELGCEELPPKSLKILAESFLAGIEAGLKNAGLAYEGARYYAAPRRLAVHIDSLALQQPDRVLSVDGPPVKAAFDANGNPTQAALGFAKKNGIDISEVDRSGEKLRYSRQVKGESATALMTQIINQSLAQLPIAKRMRWGANKVEFVRPVQWLVMLLGGDIVDGEVLGFKAGRVSRGHRFHAPAPITLNHANDYLAALKEAYVIADFAERQEIIATQLFEVAKSVGGYPCKPSSLSHVDGDWPSKGLEIIEEDLLDEVTSLVEWPVVLVGKFEERFLYVPNEALVSTMKSNQKYFPIYGTNEDGFDELKPYFAFVANVNSPTPEVIISGNEKVVRPRLTDAEFFFKQDLKVRLPVHNERLKTIIFQAQLGTMYEKAERISELSGFIAKQLKQPELYVEDAKLAGLLSKADLVGELVSEFPELQGIAGRHYMLEDLKHTEESNKNLDYISIAQAIEEQYLPKFSGDILPETTTGIAVSLADKLDTLVGIFGINQPPTGSKDPFGLRRAAIGLLRIIIEKELALDLMALIDKSLALYIPTIRAIGLVEVKKKTSEKGIDIEDNYKGSLLERCERGQARTEIFDFLLGRYRAIYEEQGIPVDVIQTVQMLKSIPTKPLDFHCRIKAVASFRNLPEAEALAAANKRVANILSKDGIRVTGGCDSTLLVDAAEVALATQVTKLQRELIPLFHKYDYTPALSSLAALRAPIDQFFDSVMVNAEDAAIRQNRLNLLASVRGLFLQVADISQLQ